MHLTRFGTLPGVLEASDLVACVPRRIAEWLARRGRLVAHDLPVAPPDVSQYMAWHRRRDADPAHLWLRGSVRRAARAGVHDNDELCR